MSKISGLEILKIIRQIDKENGAGGFDYPKVIAITSLDHKENILAAFREGCDAYIVKPVEKDKLLSEMNKLGLLEAEAR